MYEQRKVKTRWSNHCCGEKAISIKYSKRVSVTKVIQRAKRMSHICLLWPVWINHIFQHYLTNGTIFRKNVTEHYM
jgi:hypothetical protein